MAGLANRKALLGELGVDDEAQRDQDLQQQQAALGDIAGPPLENTGVTGGRGLPAPALDQPIGSGPLVDTTPTTAAAPASDISRVMGVDVGKFNDPNKRDFKYDTMRLLSRFDPRKGFTPEVIDALNKELGGIYGTFAGSGDKLSLTGAKGAMDAADFGPQDWIYALKAGNDATKWNFGGGGAGGNAGAGQSGGAPMGGGGHTVGGYALDSALTGDPLAAIQAALAKYSNSPNIQSLLAQLGGA